MCNPPGIPNANVARKKSSRTRAKAPDAFLGRASASDHEAHNKIAQEEKRYPRGPAPGSI